MAVSPGGRAAFLLARSSMAVSSDSCWNRDSNMMTAAETELFLKIMAYGLATGATLVVAYLAWRKLRPHRHHYRYHQDADAHQKGVFGWE